jgi:hypothetical protein
MLDEPAVAARRLTVAQARVDPLFAAGMRLTSRNGGKPPSGDPTPRGGAGNCHSTTAVRATLCRFVWTTVSSDHLVAGVESLGARN